MSFRTLIVKNRCKLEYSLNYLVYRGEKEIRINLNEITTIIIQCQQVAITSSLLSQLMEHKIRLIFCDDCHNPQGELVPYHSCYNSYEKIMEQMQIQQDSKDILWKRIIEQKIINQAENLKYKNLDSAEKLFQYAKEVEEGDSTNREGHAAKVYFNALFGTQFSRGLECETNAFLNYGYSILLSAINREIKNCGYLTELGIHHIGKNNPFNLSCDFIEPLRPLVDFYVISGKLNCDNFKQELVSLLSLRVRFAEKSMILENALHLYILSLMNFLISGEDQISFIEYERV